MLFRSSGFTRVWMTLCSTRSLTRSSHLLFLSNSPSLLSKQCVRDDPVNNRDNVDCIFYVHILLLLFIVFIYDFFGSGIVLLLPISVGIISASHVLLVRSAFTLGSLVGPRLGLKDTWLQTDSAPLLSCPVGSDWSQTSQLSGACLSSKSDI